jgi:hypothetical protein
MGLHFSTSSVQAENVSAFTPTDKANSPIGEARGIKPGRVSWSHDPSATNVAGSGSYADDASTDKVKVRAMLERAVCVLADKPTIADAWVTLFTHFNAAHGNTRAGYSAGEKIAVKINLNNNGGTNMIDATPQSVHALLWELVNVVGIAQTDIAIYDTMRRSGMGRVKNACQSDFPKVHYNDGSTVSAIRFSGGDITTKNVGTEVVNAKYLINMAILKRHGKPSANWIESDGNTGVTLTFKNHCGTVDNCKSLHQELRDWNQSFGSYNPLVDLAASKAVGKKTVLFLLDGLYSGNLWNSGPQKWSLAPFNGDFPSSLFASQDPVAIDSVGLDFLHAEWPLLANADNYLHEAALIASPPSGSVYKPDGTAVTESLGVHEHWNSAASKQYSRNLDPVSGKGIELVRTEDYVFGSRGGAGGTAGGSGAGGYTNVGGGGNDTSPSNGTDSGTFETGGAPTHLATAPSNEASGQSGAASSTGAGGALGTSRGGGASTAKGTNNIQNGTTGNAAGAGAPAEPAAAEINQDEDEANGCSCRTSASNVKFLGTLITVGLVSGLRKRRNKAALSTHPTR